MKFAQIAVVSALFLAMTGCASIAGDNTRAVKVTSVPSGASIYVDNQQYGTTPAIVDMPTYIYGGKTVTVKKAGYQDQSQRVNSKFQPIALLDVFFWPTFFVDAATGDLVKTDPANRNLDYKLQRA